MLKDAAVDDRRCWGDRRGGQAWRPVPTTMV